MKKVRFGVVGLGNMGLPHAKWCARDGGRDFTLGAVCDVAADKAAAVGAELNAPHFTDALAMIDSKLIDAVIVAVPHYWHAPVAIYAAKRGIHVLCEKPLESRVGLARAMIAACRNHKVAFGTVLQHRTRTIMRKMKQLVDGGAIGEVFRAQLICSNWFRTQAYYDSGAWRGTWDGEGGGVLINQGPHHLDLFQWIAGMPRRVLGLLGTRAHNIEVEDTANFLLEYDHGKVGYIYATTAEEPGYEQFMLCGDKGTLVCEAGKLRLGKLKTSVRKHIMASRNAMAGKAEQEITWSEVAFNKKPDGHLYVIRNFVAHVLGGEKLLAPGAEAVNELELSNAMYLAGFEGRTVELPVKDAEIDRLIRRLEKQRSTGKGGGLRAAAAKLMRKVTKA